MRNMLDIAGLGSMTECPIGSLLIEDGEHWQLGFIDSRRMTLRLYKCPHPIVPSAVVVKEMEFHHMQTQL